MTCTAEAMEAHFQGFFAACAGDASAKKGPGKRKQHDRAEAASVKRFRRASGEVSPARAASTTDSSAPCDAARADAGRLLQEQKKVLRRHKTVAGRDLVGAVRFEPPAAPLEVWSEKRLRKWMRANNLTEADALRLRPHIFQQEVMDMPMVYAPHNPNSNASS